MRKRTTMVALAALLLMALVPGVAFGAGLRPFTASGEIVQDPDLDGATEDILGNMVAFGAPSPLVAAAAVALEANPAIPTGAGPLVGGLYNPGQTFEGSFLKSTWRPLKTSDVAVDHNSWITANLLDLGGPGDSTPLFGIAWGFFTVSNGDQELIGGYGAILQGTLSVDIDCFAVNGTGLAVDIQDTGSWGNLSNIGDDYEDIGPSGDLVVDAIGCLGAESATLDITGSTTVGKVGNGQG